VEDRASIALLTIICLIVFLAGVFVGNVTYRPATETRRVEVRETVTVSYTVTAELPLLVVARAELYPSCIYNATQPSEDPECRENVKAVSLVLVVRNVGKIPVKVEPRSILIHGFGVDPTPDFTNPEGEIIIEPGSYSKQIIAVYIVRDPESFIRFHNSFGHTASIAYSDEKGECPNRIEEKPELIPGVWWSPG